MIQVVSARGGFRRNISPAASGARFHGIHYPVAGGESRARARGILPHRREHRNRALSAGANRRGEAAGDYFFPPEFRH
jgi:hypothetical protein